MVILQQSGRLILAGLLLLLMAGMSFAQDTQVTPSLPSDPLKTAERQNARRQTLDEEQVATERLRQEVRALTADMSAKLQALQVGQLTETLVEQAKIDTRSIQLKLEDLQTSIVSTERQIKTLEQAVRELEAKEQLLKNPAKDAAEGASRVEQLELTRQALKQQRTDLELEKQNLANLRDRLELVTQRLTLAQQWQARVEEVYRLQQAQGRREPA